VSAIKQLLGAFGGVATTVGDASNIFEAGLANAGHLAGGGPIYLAGGGGSMGTDTIPAWLTAGEFVMRKSAVDHIGLANLEVMNRFDTGEIVGATSIPSGPHQIASQTIQAENKITVNMQGSGAASDHENAKGQIALMNLIFEEALEREQRPGGRLWKAGQK